MPLVPPWADIFKIFKYAFTPDSLSRAKPTDPDGVGVGSADAIGDVRQDGSFWGGGQGLIRLRDTNEFLDLSSITSRPSRYKEYERLRNVPEIEMAMTVLADESCVASTTKVATAVWGLKSIKWLADNKKDEKFLVYCYDTGKKDYTLGWAYDPRLVKTAKTKRISFDDGSVLIATPDHRLLTKTGSWTTVGELKQGSELMPFYWKLPDHWNNTKLKHHQFPRVFTFNKGWIHERQFVDEWRLNEDLEKYKEVNYFSRLVASGSKEKQLESMSKKRFHYIDYALSKEGFTLKELRVLGKNQPKRVVVFVEDYKEMEVFDLSVEKHENFCTDWGVVHNCQKDDKGHAIKIEVDNKDVKEELEFLFYHRRMLNIDRKIWNWVKNLYIMGDLFLELVIDPESPKDGILKAKMLPADSLYRLETTKQRLLEFQQGKEGPDVQALTRAPVTQSTDAELMQTNALRFTPEQIIHARIGEDRKTFYPYGQSLIEPARGPAHQLKMMEDAMIVYRLVRAPERRVFYIDVGSLPPFKAEAFIERLKDQLKKKKVSTSRVSSGGSSAVEERYHAMPAEDDFWLPIRPGSSTKIDTLPGASNLGEIDDAIFFRNRLLTALNFPKNYFAQEDPNATRITLSSQDVKFARMIERLQLPMEDGLWEIADRHLTLMGYPPETYEDLRIKMTPPSDWRELSRQEVTNNRIQNATTIKGSQLMSDYDVLKLWMHYTEEEAQEIISRNQVQKLGDLKLQVVAQMPQLLGVGIPGQGEQEIGAQPGGANPMLNPEQTPEQGATSPEQGMSSPEQPQMKQSPTETMGTQAKPLADPTDEEIKKYDLEIQNYSKYEDDEDIDYSEL